MMSVFPSHFPGTGEDIIYAQLIQNTRPQMMQGAVLVEDGIPFLLSPHNIPSFVKMSQVNKKG